MTNKPSQSEVADYSRLSDKLSRIENSITLLDYKLKREIPPNLSDRMIILEQKLESEIKAFKKELSDARITMKERLAYISIIITLIIALISLIGGRI